MVRDIVINLRNIFIALFITFISITGAFAEEPKSASVEFSVNLPKYLQIDTVTSAVLTANITDRTGNLYAPLSTRFKVISNSRETEKLYLKAEAITENGYELAMFQYGGRVYVAFTNIARKPTSQALASCKMGLASKDSPGVVAYPINSILGVKSKFRSDLEKYELDIENGVTNIDVNIGSHVLRNSFGKNDPIGFYQATLSITEADI